MQQITPTWVSMIKLDTLSLLSDASWGPPRQPLTAEQMLESQERDPIIGPALRLKRTNQHPSSRLLTSEHSDVKVLLCQWTKLYLNPADVLCRQSGNWHQQVLPQEYCETVFTKLNREMGHPGVDRALDLIRERFYWPRMQEEAEHFIAHVCKCFTDICYSHATARRWMNWRLVGRTGARHSRLTTATPERHLCKKNTEEAAPIPPVTNEPSS